MLLQRIRWMSCALPLLLAPCVADADILKCKDAAGQVTYTQGSCPPGTQPLEASGSAPSDTRPGASTAPLAENHDNPDTAKCKGGDKQACSRLRCENGAILAVDGSDEEIRDCSRQLSLPSTSSWAQVKQQFIVHEAQGNLRQWTGDYICLGRNAMRPFLTVSQAMRGGAPVPGFQLGNTPTIFPTKVAAVEAGCAAKTGGQKPGGR
jgi:uncharacterized protein DUF4124